MTSDLTGLTVVRLGEGRVANLLFSSDDRAVRLQELEEVMGVGPAETAVRGRGPVFTADLRSWETPDTWAPFAHEADLLGVRSVVVFPLQIGAVMLGLATFHGTVPASLAPADLGALLRVLDVLALALLAGADISDFENWSEDLLDLHHAEIHQAAGMAMVQLGGSLEDAMVALRAKAFATGQSLARVARQVVQRSVRFEPPPARDPADSREDPEDTGDERGH